MLKSSFSLGFRSYIRQFLGALLMRFRPSLPWGSCRWEWFDFRLPFEQKEWQEQEQEHEQQQQQETARRKKELKSPFSMGFRSYIREFFGAILMLFRPSLPSGFATGSGSILGCLLDRSSRSSSSRRKQLKMIIFYGFQKLH